MKQLVRSQMKLFRDSLTPMDISLRSERIMRRVLSLDEVKNASVVFVYVSVGNEVYTHDLIKSFLSKGIRVLVPHWDGEVMYACPLASWDELVVRDGYLVPSTPPTSVSPDISIIPGLAFSVALDRLGSGFGYYDKYLASVRTTAIGVAFDEQVLLEVPLESHDKRMNLVVTDKRII